MNIGPIAKPSIEPIGSPSEPIEAAIILSSSLNQTVAIYEKLFMRKGYARPAKTWNPM